MATSCMKMRFGGILLGPFSIFERQENVAVGVHPQGLAVAITFPWQENKRTFVIDTDGSPDHDGGDVVAAFSDAGDWLLDPFLALGSFWKQHRLDGVVIGC
eukprot:GILJ01020820.1.p1 GENE.GILJ01020820.1~~GILJ01020820.1.p1  ORF type:complete len:101 (-),score=14.26 GILJ01020820.1:576-878(-)